MALRVPTFRGGVAMNVAFAFLLLPVLVRALDDAEADSYAPEIEGKFQELMKKAGEAKTTNETTQFQRERAALVKAVGLDEAGQKKLEGGAAAAVEASVKEWQQKMGKSMRANWGTGITVETLDQWLAQVSSLVRNDGGLDYVTPSDQPAWKEAVARVLTAQQAEAWKKDFEGGRRKFDEETKGVIAATKARYREQDAAATAAKVAAIVQTLGLDEERTKKLEKLGEQAAEKAGDGIGEKARKTLLGFDEANRKRIIKSNNLYIAPDEKAGPETLAVWKDGLKEILTPEEMKRWQTALDQSAERRVAKFGRMLVWALDQAIAFTATQREQIRPIAEKCVREKNSLFVERRGSPYTSYSVEIFYRAAAAAKEEDLRKILDENQVEHWKRLSGKQTAAERMTAIRARNATAAAKEGVKLAAFEPEELENAISDQLAEMATREKETLLANFLLQAEDAIRVTGVEGKAVQRLQTAARGAMEVDFNNWRESWAGNIRSQLQGATPADFQQRLQNIGMNSSGRRRPAAGTGVEGIWGKTIAKELTEAQRAAWKKETDARDADERQTSFVTLVGEIDRICMLTEEQRGKFEPLLSAHLKEYEPELRNMFSQGNNGWFLMGYYMLTPVAGMGEKELRKILTDEQWKALSGTQQFTNGARYWENIEQNRKNRVKEEKK